MSDIVTTPSPSAWRRVPKILGADVELGNFIEGVDAPLGSGGIASRLLLAQISGISAGAAHTVVSPTIGTMARYDSSHPSQSGRLLAAPENHEPEAGRRGGRVGYALANHAQDWGRRFFPSNGASVYIDLDHLELALPETSSAFDHLIYWRAMLQVARGAVTRANQRLPHGCRLRALANSSDGHGQSYGAHTSVLVSRPTWEAIVRRKPHYLACLAAFQVSSIVFTGAGKVGSENGRPWADYQLTQRGDFFETLLGEQTTFYRPIVNSRDEPLCGGYRQQARGDVALARLHVIFFDPTLCQVATLLRVGTLQIVTSMIEAGWVPQALALDDPLDALQRWGHDPSLLAVASLVTGQDVTAVELQQRFLDEARRFDAIHGFNGIVPRAAQILDLWEDTLIKLRARDFASLSRRLDWVLKRQLLERAMAGRPGLDWSSPEVRHLDQIFASVDPAEGLFWTCEQAGLVDVIAGEDQVQRAMRDPPADTRAWTRAHLMRRAGASRVDEIDWDLVRVRIDESGPHWPGEGRIVYLPCPFEATKHENAELFRRHRSLEEIVDALHGEQAPVIAPASSQYPVC